jgi:hypothetical protein
MIAFTVGVLFGILAAAFWLGATRKDDAERARDDADQVRAIRPSGETGIA